LRACRKTRILPDKRWVQTARCNYRNGC